MADVKTKVPSLKTLSKIKSGALSRGLSLAKMSLNVGARAAGHAIGGVFSGAEKDERLKTLLMSQLKVLSTELGQLKGSVMKVGQMLSVVGEYFLPPEANELLKSLQNQSPPLAWPEIEKVLKRELGKQSLAELEISNEPMASASLGQVHRAVRKSDGAVIALKIQYPGVDKAIEGDIKVLKYVLSVTNLIPKGPKYEQIFEEVKTMLHQEVDYVQEMKTTQEFKELLKDFPQYIIPTPFPEYSTRRVLATTLEEGIAIDSVEAKDFTQERRDKLARNVLQLYFMEIFRFNTMQTDPHFGNYRVRVGKTPEEDQLILFDFGAVRKFPAKFISHYRELVESSLNQEPKRIAKAATDLKFIHDDDTPEMIEEFVNLCMLIIEPFRGGVYNWGETDLPNRVGVSASKLAISFRLRPPPREIVFLDRKMAGVFIFLSVLKAKVDARALLESYLELKPGKS
jgi:predicted unusual protein kinase regulating ubiquinone biosynthesis (AarF/ABC1/UbiB family)